MNQHALGDYEGPVINQLLAAGHEHSSVPTTLGDLITALQEATPDDRLVLAAVNDLMTHGRLKKRADH